MAHHFHWPLEEILDLEHQDRQHFIAAIARFAGHDGQE